MFSLIAHSRSIFIILLNAYVFMLLHKPPRLCHSMQNESGVCVLAPVVLFVPSKAVLLLLDRNGVVSAKKKRRCSS